MSRLTETWTNAEFRTIGGKIKIRWLIDRFGEPEESVEHGDVKMASVILAAGSIRAYRNISL